MAKWQVVQPAHTAGGGGSGGVAVTLSGNTSGALAEISSGTLTLAGGNNVTLSQAGNAVTISGAAAGGAQTAISGISASDTLYTSGTVRLTGVGGGVTVSSNTGQRVDISVAAPVAQTAQTGISGIRASDATYTSGSVTFTGVGGGITVSSNTGQRVDLSVAAPVAQTGTQFSAGISGGNTAGDTGTVAGRVVFAGGANVTLSGSTNGASETVSIVGGAGGGAETQTAISGIAASNATYTSGSVTFTGVGGGVTVSSNTGQRVDISVAAPVAQTAETAISGIVASNSTYTSGTVQISGENNITVHSSTAAAGVQRVLISGPNTSAQQTGISALSNSNTTFTSGTVGLSELGAITIRSTTGNQFQFSVNAQTGTQYSGGISNLGNTAGDTGTVAGRLVLVGSDNITLSGSTNGVSETVSIIGPSPGAGAGFSAGISGGNTSNHSGVVTGRLVLAGGNNITLSGSTNAGSESITVSAAAQSVQTQNVHNLSISTTDGGGTSGTMAEISSGTVTMYAGNNITISQSATNKVVLSALQSSSLSAYTNITLSVTDSTIKFSVANPPKIAYWRNFERQDASAVLHLSAISKTPYYFEEIIPGAVTLNSIVFHLSNVTTATLQSFDIHFGVYTFVNSTSAALLGSASNNFNVSTASSASWSGQRDWILTSPSTQTGISNLTPGNYLFGVMFSAGASQSMNQSLYMAPGTTVAPLGRVLPGNNQLSTATSQGALAMFGAGSVTVNALPANIVASDIRNQGSAAGSIAIRPWMEIRS